EDASWNVSSATKPRAARYSNCVVGSGLGAGLHPCFGMAGHVGRLDRALRALDNRPDQCGERQDEAAASAGGAVCEVVRHSVRLSERPKGQCLNEARLRARFLL